VLLALAVPLASRAAPAADPAARFKATGLTQEVTPVVKPIVLDGGQRVQVMVRLTADPVAAVKAKAPDHAISAAQRAEVVRALGGDHDAVARLITARGGKVITHLYDAWNGMRVEVARGAVGDVARLPGVRSVTPVRVYQRDNANSVPFIGAPAVWAGVPGLTGDRVKVGVIDTGIDYTHADFGGPGTPAAFAAASAASTSPADPALFGPAAPKVKGGIDLVGDDYDASVAGSLPVPDPNPLDCAGHGSHVSGTIGGFGVNVDGTTYAGPYDATTPSHAFRIGPGVAPGVDLYAIRVFGCAGSTDVVAEAIDWAVKNDLQVVNMSLGSPFGDAESADAQAADAAAQAGVVVIASAGNSGPAPYVNGSPGAAAGALSVAAVDSYASFPGATLTLDTGASLAAIDANGLPLPAGPLPLVVLRTGTGTVSLGCSDAEYADVAGKVVVTQRGTCDRVARAKFGAAHGAAAVIMINTSAGYPPYEGPIPGGNIPFLGVLTADAAKLLAATSVASFASSTVPNPTARFAAAFSSGGARFYDSAMKPDIAAPGVSIFSVAVGSGNGGEMMSGTSMAAPHATGVAALTVQAHPGWNTEALRAAIENTSDPTLTASYDPRVLGAGLVQPALSTKTRLVAFSLTGADGLRRAALDFGFAEFRRDYHASEPLVVQNLSDRAVTVELATATSVGAPHSVSLSATRLRIPAHQARLVSVRLAVPAATVGDSADFRQVTGAVIVTPQGGANQGIALRVPYFLASRARSNVDVALGKVSRDRSSVALLLKNAGTKVPGTADFYEWGLASGSDDLGAMDLRAAGAQACPSGASDRLVVFAVNTWQRWSSAAPHEVDVLVDVNGDGVFDYAVIAIDNGALTTGSYDGNVVSAVVNLTTGKALVRYLATAPTDGSTLLLPALASDLGLSAANPRFSYTAQSFDGLTGAQDAFADAATFDAWNGALVLPDFVAVDPGATVTTPLSVNRATYRAAPPRGLMVVRQENLSGQDEAQLIHLP
jgi:subtilisin family serine protease